MPNYVIDLFSGAGGLTEGFANEGFDIIAHIEKDPWACETLKTRICYHWLRKNNLLNIYNNYLKLTESISKNTTLKEQIFYHRYPELKDLTTRVFNKTFGDTSKSPDTISSADAIRYINNIIKKNQISSISTVIGGPPCQAYSLIGRGRMGEQASNDDRNFLFRYYLDIVKEFQPKLFVFENVPGILSAQKGQLFPAIRDEFSKIGYGFVSGPDKADYKNVIDCKDYGVYQTRKRVILFGYKKAAYPQEFNYPNFKQFVKYLDEPLTTENALSDLPPLRVGEGSDFWYAKYNKHRKLSKYQLMMREESPGVLNHRARLHREVDLKIYSKQIKASLRGEKLAYSQLPKELQFHKNCNQKVFEDRFRVHGSREVPHTIVAHISKDGHYNIHPDIGQLRSLTVREAARIQSFPDNYFFEGPRTAQFIQVGNAVPPLFSRIIAKAVKTEFDYKAVN